VNVPAGMTPRQLREAVEKLAIGFDHAQVQSFVRQVRDDARDAWDWMTPRMHEALIAERAFAVIRGQHAEAVKVATMDGLLAAMRLVAGLATLAEVSS